MGFGINDIRFTSSSQPTPETGAKPGGVHANKTSEPPAGDGYAPTGPADQGLKAFTKANSFAALTAEQPAPKVDVPATDGGENPHLANLSPSWTAPKVDPPQVDNPYFNASAADLQSHLWTFAYEPGQSSFEVTSHELAHSERASRELDASGFLSAQPGSHLLDGGDPSSKAIYTGAAGEVVLHSSRLTQDVGEAVYTGAAGEVVPHSSRLTQDRGEVIYTGAAGDVLSPSSLHAQLGQELGDAINRHVADSNR